MFACNQSWADIVNIKKKKKLKKKKIQGTKTTDDANFSFRD
jgi:hypothetical protein